MIRRSGYLGAFVAAAWIVCPAFAAGAGAQPSGASQSREQLVQLVDGMKTDLESLEKSHQAVARAAEKLSEFYSRLAEQVDRVAKLSGSASSGSAGQAQLLAATKQMQEMRMSFNLQYLQLQNSMQNENRQFTMISNIMKTKHDTVKNSINNIR